MLTLVEHVPFSNENFNICVYGTLRTLAECLIRKWGCGLVLLIFIFISICNSETANGNENKQLET